MPKTRAAAPEQTGPPAKRRKAGTGFESVLLNQKNKSIPQAHTTKLNGNATSRITEDQVVVNTANRDAGARKGKQDVVDISSDSSSDDSDENEEIEAEPRKHVNGAVNGVKHTEEAEEVDEDAAAGAEEPTESMDEGEGEGEGELMTFGDHLSAQNAEPIDVEGVIAQNEDDSPDETRQNARQQALARVPAGATFSTVLTQALRTKDNALLDTCFENTDIESVRETISRLDSRLAIPLMERIAEVVSKAPGRLGSLMVWIQWAVIAHGGYLAGISDIRKRVAGLHQVIVMRAEGLQPLLQLKGKLDMLSAQQDIRKDEQDRNAREEEDEEGAVTRYVESDEEDESHSDSGSESSDELMLNGLAQSDEEMGSDEEDEDNLGVFAKGVVKGDVERSDESDAEDGFIDDEAEEEDDEDDDDDEDDSEEEDSD